MFVYVIVNSETLKIYIGQHKGTNLRQYLQKKLWCSKHRLEERSRLYEAMRQYPHVAWSIHPLFSDLQTRDECDYWERLLIDALNSQHLDVGYNICRGGEGFTGPHTDEWRKETLTRIQKYWANPESHGLRSQQMKDIWAASPERSQAQTERMTGNQINLGRAQSEEEKQQRSLSMQGKQNTLGHKLTDEHKKKQSVSLKKFYQENPKGSWSPNLRAKLSGPARIVSEETRRKQSDAAKRRSQTPEGLAHLQRAGAQSRLRQEQDSLIHR